MRFYKRVYDPAIGQWLTPDPLGFADGPNLYAYVHSNPLRFCDPYGLSMKEFFKGFAASAAQVGAACVAKWAVVGAVSFFCPPLGAAVSSAMTAYSVGMTAYSVGKCAYDNYDTLQEIGDAALAGDLGQIAAWGIDAVCSMSYEQLGSLAFDAVSIAAPVARAKGAKAVADAKAASVAEKVEKAAKSTPVVGPTKQSLPTKLDLDALSKAGQVHDRNGLTLAGRSLDKHGNRVGSPFPLATGNPQLKNIQGQFHLRYFQMLCLESLNAP